MKRKEIKENIKEKDLNKKKSKISGKYNTKFELTRISGLKSFLKELPM